MYTHPHPMKLYNCCFISLCTPEEVHSELSFKLIHAECKLFDTIMIFVFLQLFESLQLSVEKKQMSTECC